MNEAQAAQNLTGALTGLDGVVCAAILAVLLVIAYVTGRREKDTDEYFLGGRRVPAVVACLSFVATEVSAVTIIAVPAAGFRENWQYLQFFIGSAAARLLVAILFIPVFYRYRCTTIYEFLKHRFGGTTQYAGSVFFFITRLLASGVRLYAACLGVSVILGWSLGASLALFTAVSIAYIAFGGIKAVVWTGAYETAVFYAAGFVVGGYLLWQIQGPLSEAWQTAADAGRLSLFNYGVAEPVPGESWWGTINRFLADPKTLWAATLNAFFVGLCVFGTDQEMMQRLLTVKTRRSSQRAILGTILAALPLVATYLALGTLLFVFYHQHPDLSLPDNSDKILSHFVVHILPTGLKGLVLAAIVLASIDSPLSSLSSSFVTDIYRPLIRRSASEKHYLWVSRAGVVAFGILLAGLAYLCRNLEGILWVAFEILAVTGGSTLGVFLLGLLTKRRCNRGNVVAMTVSAVAMAILLFLGEGKDYIAALGWDWLTALSSQVTIGWSWLIVIGTVVTFVLGYLLGRPPSADEQGQGEGQGGEATAPEGVGR